MNKLLKLEFRKLGKQKSYYICLAVMILMLILTALVLKIMPKIISGALPEDSQVTISSQLNMVPEEKGEFILAAASNALFTLLSSVFIAIAFCEDYDQQILKNTFARGYSRSSVYLSKIIHIFFSCTIMYLIVVLASGAVSALILGMKSLEPAVFKHIAVQYLVCMAYVALSIAICGLIRKTGLTIAISIVIHSIVGLVISLVEMLLKIKDSVISKYWLDGLLSDTANFATDDKRLVIIAVAAVIYIAVFLIVGHFSTRRVEI